MSTRVDLEALGKRIKSLRERISRADFAERFHVAASSLARWESGDNSPDLNFLTRLASEFGMPLEALLYGPDGDFASSKTSDNRPLFEENTIQHTDNTGRERTGQAAAASFSQPDQTEITILASHLREMSSLLMEATKERQQLERENADLRIERERLLARIQELQNAAPSSPNQVFHNSPVGDAVGRDKIVLGGRLKK